MSSSDDDDEDFVPPPSPSKVHARRADSVAADADESAASAAATAASLASASASDTLAELHAASGISQRAVDKSAKFLSRLTSTKQPKSLKKRKLRDFQVPVLSLDVHKRRADISAAAATASASATVREVVKFAGVEYSVSKKTAVAPRSAKASGLDQMLASLDAPKKVSTMEKTSLDWDAFKAVEGIDDELQQYTKDGYLEKQDFLQRVDRKQFELEKAERDRKRKLQQQQQQG